MKFLLIFGSALAIFSSSLGFGNSVSNWKTEVSNRETFNELSVVDDTPGSLGIRVIKFLICDVDTTSPCIYFINTNKYAYHYSFANEALKIEMDLEQFNRKTYFTDNRSFLAGTILAYDNFIQTNGQKGVYVFEFWPTDPVKVQFTNIAFRLLYTHMSFASNCIFYHPAGETHSGLLADEKEAYKRLEIPFLTSEVLFQNLTFSPLNLGEGYGYLRVADPAAVATYGVRDIVIFKSIPNELSHVAGVLTEEPQTPLSHINLKAKQNKTPNAYLKAASSNPEISTLIGQPVHLRVHADGVQIRLATTQEIDTHLEKIRPRNTQFPDRDLSVISIKSLNEIRNKDALIFGAKAANVGELKSILFDNVVVPEGFAIPFYFYDTFMRQSGLYDYARAMINDPEFKSSPDKRESALKAFRKKIKQAEVPEQLQESLDEMHNKIPVGIPIRCRSSTNNEDLTGFNGAGLYDSYTHRPDEGNISKTIKEVFASLWNKRAFEEREFYRIDHFQTAMGVLVHPNYDNELSNGVAVTKNPYDPHWGGCYINVQVGEALVTNPEIGAVPEEILVMKTSISHEEEGFETIFIRHSSLVEKGRTVMAAEQIERLAKNLEIIQKHFFSVYKRTEDDGFAMDIEFKIDKEGRLVIKQARPWVD